MRTYKVFGLITILALLIAAMPMQNAYGSDVLVYNLQPSWDAPGGGGVWAAYYGPPDYSAVSPGATALYDGREAGIIKAGLVPDPGDGNYWDEGLLAFKVPNVAVSEFASQVLSYDVRNETGPNPVWVRIRLMGGIQYQFVPTTNPAGWHTVDAAAGLWQLMDENGNGTGGLMTLSGVAEANPGASVDRVYLTLGMGDSYNVSPGVGTVGWVDKVTIGGVTYNFVVFKEFKGFFQPINSGIVNNAKAGQAIPAKWQLLENGVPISDPASFAGLHSYPVDCANFAGGPEDVIEEYAGNSGLEYKGDGYWQFNWKTPKNYAGSCRAMYVEFSNGQTSPIILFQFNKEQRPRGQPLTFDTFLSG
jgi:hypothetical protein